MRPPPTQTQQPVALDRCSNRLCTMRAYKPEAPCPRQVQSHTTPTPPNVRGTSSEYLQWSRAQTQDFIIYPRRCATSSPAQSSTVPSSTLSQILCSYNGLFSLTRTSSHACCLFRGTRRDYNDAMRPNHLDRALIFSLFYLYVCLFVLYFIIVSRSR